MTTEKEKLENVESQPFADLSGAPLPTPQTLRFRKNLLAQFFKFVGFDVRIMRMVIKGHSQ